MHALECCKQPDNCCCTCQNTGSRMSVCVQRSCACIDPPSSVTASAMAACYHSCGAFATVTTQVPWACDYGSNAMLAMFCIMTYPAGNHQSHACLGMEEHQLKELAYTIFFGACGKRSNAEHVQVMRAQLEVSSSANRFSIPCPPARCQGLPNFLACPCRC